MTQKSDLPGLAYTALASFLSRLHKCVCVLLALGMALIMFAVVFHVFGRYFFGKTYMGTMEFVRYTMIWVSMLGAAAAFGLKEHPCIVILCQRLGARSWFLVHMAGYGMLCLFLIIMIIGGFQIALRNWHQTSLGLQIPMFYPYLGIPAGGLVILPYVVMDMLNALLIIKGKKEIRL